MKAYTYIVQGGGGETERISGVLESADRRELQTQLMETNLASVTSPFVGMCPTETDGLAYRYTIANEETEYTFDSCEVRLTGIPLFDTLEEYFGTFASVYETSNE
jgi:hypothetical protein